MILLCASGDSEYFYCSGVEHTAQRTVAVSERGVSSEAGRRLRCKHAHPLITSTKLLRQAPELHELYLIYSVLQFEIVYYEDEEKNK